MEQVFFRLHVRSHRYITRVFPPKVRQATEVVLLGSVLCLVSLLVVLHMSHVLPHDGGCLRGLVPDMRGGTSLPFDVLRVRIVPPEHNELSEAFSRVSEAVRGQFISLSQAKDGRATPCSPADSHRASGASGGGGGGGGGGSMGVKRRSGRALSRPARRRKARATSRLVGVAAAESASGLDHDSRAIVNEAP